MQGRLEDSGLLAWWSKLPQLSERHTKRTERPKILVSIAVMLQLLASFLAFVQVVFSTLMLSSLKFVGFHDTLVILARLVLSALVYRLITWLETVCTRKELDV